MFVQKIFWGASESEHTLSTGATQSVNQPGNWLIVSSKFEDSQSPDETHESGFFPFKKYLDGASNDILDEPGQPSQPGQLIH